MLKESGNAAIKATTSRYSNAATLHGKTQDQSSKDEPGQKAEEKSLDNKSSDDKFKGRKCVCGEVHLFKECPYIVTAARKNFPGWKENAKTLTEARQRILKNARFRTAIKAITDTNILNGLDGETAQKKDTETAELNGTMPSFRFGNVAMISTSVSASKIKNPVSNSVIYDSGCNQPLTYDKARFVGEITPANEWVDTPNEAMLVEDYVWDMQEDVLIHKTSGQKVCNIEKHYGLATIEFNPVEITHAAVEKNAPLMAKPLAKENASEENPPIVAKEDAPTEKKMNTEQKEDAPTLKKPHTDPVLAAVTVTSGGGKLVDHQELFGPATPASIG